MLFVIPDDERHRDIADFAGRSADALRWAHVETKTLNQSGNVLITIPPDVVLWLGDSKSLGAFLENRAQANHFPIVLAPGSLIGREVFEAQSGFANKLFLAFPTLPTDQSRGGEKDFVELARAANLNQPHLPTGLTALTSAKLLLHALQESGRNLRAPDFVEKLETLYEFPTGHSTPLSFSKQRRIGVRESHIAAVDLTRKALASTGKRIGPPDVR